MLINLKKFYPDLYKEDTMIEVSEEIATIMNDFESKQHTQDRKIRYHKAYYSLQATDLEKYKIVGLDIFQENLEYEDAMQILYNAIGKLPYKQARRIYAYFMLDMTEKEISEYEDVSLQSISKSVQKGCKSIKKILHKILR